jgi:hypothetical protein
VLESKSAREVGRSSQKVEGPMAYARGIQPEKFGQRLDGYSPILYHNARRQARQARATDLTLQVCVG